MVTFFKSLRGKKIDAECDNSAPADRTLKADSLLNSNSQLAGAQSPASSVHPITASPSHSNGTTDTVLSPQQLSATAPVSDDVLCDRKIAAKSSSTYGDEKLMIWCRRAAIVVVQLCSTQQMLLLRHCAVANGAVKRFPQLSRALHYHFACACSPPLHSLSVCAQDAFATAAYEAYGTDDGQYDSPYSTNDTASASKEEILAMRH
eukprot:16831-Heterococcus_DN1.PRE.2